MMKRPSRIIAAAAFCCLAMFALLWIQVRSEDRPWQGDGNAQLDEGRLNARYRQARREHAAEERRENSTPSLFEAWMHADGPETADLLRAIGGRGGEARALIIDQLRHGDGHARYRAARLAGELGAEECGPALLELAGDARAEEAARVSALYALGQLSLEKSDVATLVRLTVEDGSTLVRRSALAALSGKLSPDDVPAITPLRRDGDALVRVYAARLLLEQGDDPGYAFFSALAEHSDAQVRREAYDAAAWSDAKGVAALLEAASMNETSQGAARAASLALGLHRARRISNEAESAFFTRVLDEGDDHARLWALDTLMKRDREAGAVALARVAGLDSDLGEYAGALLAARHPDVSPSSLDTKTAAAPPVLEKHYQPVHNTLTVWSLARYHAQEGVPVMPYASRAEILRANREEDAGAAPMSHAYNPLTGRGFIGYRGFGGPAGAYSAGLIEELQAEVEAGHTHNALVLAGRLMHLIEDMSSPLHIFGVWHPFGTCLFERYWPEYVTDIETFLRAAEIVPALPGEIPTGSADRIEPFWRERLEARLSGLPESLYGYFEAMAWLTYFNMTFWGEVRFYDRAADVDTLEATFPEETVAARRNVLYDMFDGHIRYHTSWLRDYFVIEDRLGNTYVWNKCFALDGFRPCPNPREGLSREGHLRDTVETDAGALLRLTGRFYFTQRGFSVPHCHPFRYPDGAPMKKHLSRYFGEVLMPANVAYGAGWFNALADMAPFLFEGGKEQGSAAGEDAFEVTGRRRGAGGAFSREHLQGSLFRPETAPLSEQQEEARENVGRSWAGLAELMARLKSIPAGRGCFAVEEEVR